MSKKKYFPNNWEAIKNAPSEYFEELPFEQFMDWRVDGWQIPSSITCIIREQNIKTGKITEHVYNTRGNAKRKVNSIMKQGESEFFLCDHEGMHHLFPKEHFNDKDYDYEV
tara:strand:+ start:884 stop:1216 length:333 start_codon:yes stop_codon:yes gene_type:complete